MASTLAAAMNTSETEAMTTSEAAAMDTSAAAIITSEAMTTSEASEAMTTSESTSVAMTKTTTMRHSFDRFGDDLTQLVLSYMTISPEDKWKLQFVSKQWQRLMFNTVTDIEIDIRFWNDMRRAEWFLSIVRKCRNIRRLVIRDHTKDTARSVVDILCDHLMANCPHIRHLSLETDDTSSAYTGFNRLLTSVSQQLSSLEWITYWKNHRKVVRIVSEYLPQIPKLVITDRSLPFAELREFYIEKDLCILPASIKSVAIGLRANDWQSLIDQFATNYGRQLTELDIAVKLNNETDIVLLVTALTQMSQLRRLRLNFYQTPLMDQFVCQLLSLEFSRNCPNLNHLTIICAQYASYIGIKKKTFEELIKTLSTDLKQLKRLTISCHIGYRFDEKYLLTSGQLKQMKRLTHLSLNLSGFNISDKFFVNIDDNLPRLQLIDITGVVITRTAIQSLAKLRHLNTVRLASCSNDLIDDQYIVGDLLDGQPKVTNVYVAHSSRDFRHKFTRGYIETENLVITGKTIY